MAARGIYLVGFSGTGKSTVARLVGERLGWPAFDLDQLIAERAGTTVPALFEREGEAGFRRRESEALRTVAAGGPFVVATGGGAAVDPENRALMASRGWIVTLEGRPETLLERIQAQLQKAAPDATRPLLEAADPLERVRALKERRQPAYALCDWTVHTDRLSPAQVAEEVVRACRILGAAGPGAPPAAEGAGNVVLHEVGPRDGLQGEERLVPTARKLEWIRQLVAAGVDIVQVGSFVRADKVPAMADTGELFRQLAGEARGRSVLSALVLNEEGLERALAAGVELVCMGLSASDTHGRRNAGMTTAEALPRIVAMGRSALAAGSQVQVSVQSAFGCGYEGPVPEERVLGVVEAYAAAGLRNVSLADSAGHAHPGQVKRLFGELFRRLPDTRLTCHFHDTYGLGLANVHAALEAGATVFETSCGGLGGCPFTRSPAGNVATEDLVHALQRGGLRRDVSVPKLVEVARGLSAFFGRELPGRVHKVGPLPG